MLDEDSGSRRFAHADLRARDSGSRVSDPHALLFSSSRSVSMESLLATADSQRIRHDERPRIRLRVHDSLRSRWYRDGAGWKVVRSKWVSGGFIWRWARSRVRQDFRRRLRARPLLELACITIAAAGTSSCIGPFWAIPAGFLAEAATAGGIALINSVGNLGGFAGPYLAGFIVERTHEFFGGNDHDGNSAGNRRRGCARALTREPNPVDSSDNVTYCC